MESQGLRVRWPQDNKQATPQAASVFSDDTEGHKAVAATSAQRDTRPSEETGGMDEPLTAQEDAQALQDLLALQACGLPVVLPRGAKWAKLCSSQL